MTALPLDITSARSVPAGSRDRGFTIDLSGLGAQVGVLAERTLTLAVLVLMALAGLVIAGTVFGVMTGLIA